MSGTSQAEPQTDGPDLEVNFLDPSELRFERMAYGGLQLKTSDGVVYDHLRVYRAFPLSKPDEYIALRVGDSELEQREIGMIRRLADLRPEDRRLIKEDLRKRYFIHTVKRIVSIREDMGYFYWVVETDKGRREFPVPIRPRYITHVGVRGRLIMDIDGNRYDIPDLEELDIHSQVVFHRYIYW